MDLFVEVVPGYNRIYFLHYRRECGTASYYEIEMALWDRILYISVELKNDRRTELRNHDSEQDRYSADGVESPNDSR